MPPGRRRRPCPWDESSPTRWRRSPRPGTRTATRSPWTAPTTTYPLPALARGGASFYALAEAQASKGIADWQMLRRKLPDELFLDRRTFRTTCSAATTWPRSSPRSTRAVDVAFAELGDAGPSTCSPSPAGSATAWVRVWAGVVPSTGRRPLRPAGRRLRHARRRGRLRPPRGHGRRRGSDKVEERAALGGSRSASPTSSPSSTRTDPTRARDLFAAHRAHWAGEPRRGAHRRHRPRRHARPHRVDVEPVRRARVVIVAARPAPGACSPGPGGEAALCSSAARWSRPGSGSARSCCGRAAAVEIDDGTHRTTCAGRHDRDAAPAHEPRPRRPASTAYDPDRWTAGACPPTPSCPHAGAGHDVRPRLHTCPAQPFSAAMCRSRGPSAAALLATTSPPNSTASARCPSRSAASPAASAPCEVRFRVR